MVENLIFGIPSSFLLEYNLVILTITAIFFSLSSLGQNLRKTLEEAKGIIKDIEQEDNKFYDTINTSANSKIKKLFNLLDRMGIIFRTCIYLIVITLVLIIINLKTGDFSIPITIGKHTTQITQYILHLSISIFTIVSTWYFLLNVHYFKYIYHFDFVNYVEYLIKKETIVRSKDYPLILDLSKQSKKEEEVKFGFWKRVTYLLPISPFKIKRKTKNESREEEKPMRRYELFLKKTKDRTKKKK